MLAVRRTDVDELYLRARSHMRAAVPPLTVPVGPNTDRTCTAGDLVIARRNDHCHGLIDGQRGTVTAVAPTAAR